MKTIEQQNVISFETSKKDIVLIDRIAARAIKLAKKFGSTDLKQITIDMDITACHCNGCELDLKKLLDFDDFNFSHDVFGIHSHINRDTGKLGNCFVPRCAI